MKFNTPYDRERQPAEKNDGPILVETAGYIPNQKRIESLIAAGFRLAMIRQDQYDYPDGIDSDNAKVVPSRYGNYDLVDAQRDIKRLGDKKRAWEESKKASKTAQDASQATENVEAGVNPA